MRIPFLVFIALALVCLTGSAFAQSSGDDVFNVEGISDGCGDTMNPDECMFGDSGGGGGGGSTFGCQYCYAQEGRPYANCFSGASGLPFNKYTNCQGSRICYWIAPGIRYCQPICLGASCLTA
ncbi:MAG: hypothetical protein QOE82_1830 [Thermoanaerobaculia bacterium]|jgi:hypothetical protein|nr:hypothetical protein [Thermoanaerobaculia bacterium]